MIFSTISQVSGSMYVRSAVPGSVMIVAGLELTSTTSYPSSRRRLARLGAGVVELAGLADDDRAGADDQDLLEVVASRHVASPSQQVEAEARETIASLLATPSAGSKISRS